MGLTLGDLEAAQPFRFGLCVDGPATGLYIAVTSLAPVPNDGTKFWDVEFSAPVLGIEDEVEDAMLVTISPAGDLRLPAWVLATTVRWVTDVTDRANVSKIFGIDMDLPD